MLFKQFALFLLATSSTWRPMWRKNGRHSHVVRRQLVALAQEQRNVRIDLSKKEVSSFAGDSITGNVVDVGDPNSKGKVGRDDGETVLNISGSFDPTLAGPNDGTIVGGGVGGPSSKNKGGSDHTVLDFNPVVNDRPRQLVVTRKVDKTSKKSAGRCLDEIVGEHRHLVPCDDAPVGISSVGQSCYTTNIPGGGVTGGTYCQDDSECCEKEAKCVRSFFGVFPLRFEYGTCIIPDACRRNLGVNGLLTCGDNALSSNFNQECCPDLEGTPQECIRIRGTTDGTAGQIRCAPACEITGGDDQWCAQTNWLQANLNLATCGDDRACCDNSISRSKWQLGSDGNMCLPANCLRNAGGCPPIGLANGWQDTICGGDEDEACCNGAVQQRDWKVRDPEAKCTPAPTPAPVSRPPTEPGAPPPAACNPNNDCECAYQNGFCRSVANPLLGIVQCPNEQRFGWQALSCNCDDALLTYKNC